MDNVSATAFTIVVFLPNRDHKLLFARAVNHPEYKTPLNAELIVFEDAILSFKRMFTERYLSVSKSD